MKGNNIKIITTFVEMKKNAFVLTMARRLSLGGKNRVASVIAVAGVSCAVAVMILTLSVSGGFKDAIKDKLIGFDAEITVQPPYSYTYGSQSEFLRVTPGMIKAVTSTVHEADVSAVLRQPGILKTEDDYAALVFTAFDSNHDYTFERQNMVAGRLPDSPAGKDSIVISKIVADRLGLKTGDRVTACFFVNDNIKARKFTVSGLYASNFGDYDKTVCYTSIDMLRSVSDLDSLGASALELRHIPEDLIPSRAEMLQNHFIKIAQEEQSDSVYVVDNVTHSGAMYLNWLELLDTNVVVIFVIMCFVAAFTLISSLFILILNNVSVIGLLRSLGASKSSVRNVFVSLALRLVGSGMIIGDIISILIIWMQTTYHLIPLTPEMYYLSYVPMNFYWSGMILVNIGVVIFSWTILVLPARLASGISPAKTMRYE